MRQKIKFPAIWVEFPRDPPSDFYSDYLVIGSSAEFLTFSRLPDRKKFAAGWLFDSEGNIWSTSAPDQWYFLPRRANRILEMLILPGLLWALIRYLVWVGPKIRGRRMASISEFKSDLVRSISLHSQSDAAELSLRLKDKITVNQCISEFRNWVTFGGNRDEDGHFLS